MATEKKYWPVGYELWKSDLIKMMKSSGVSGFWYQRIHDAMLHMLWDGNGITAAQVISISKDWPLAGAVKFYRAGDGKVFSLVHRSNKFVCKESSR